MQFVDGYEGWVDSKQYQIISESSFDLLSEDPIILNSDLVEYITDSSNLLIPIPLGSSLSFINHAEINKSKFDFEGTKANGVKDKKKKSYKHSLLFERTIFGAENTFGIDWVLPKWYTSSMAINY
jgi:hypothetical protein